LKVAPLTILHTIAEHYQRDARDFLERFDILWEAQLHKTGRMKSFVDLLLACECTLKCHIVLGRLGDDPCAVYQGVREYRHDIGRLAGAATYLQDKTLYSEVGKRLAPFSVFIRYSLDAYETFFPSALDRADARIDYSASIGKHPWVLECRGMVSSLLDETYSEFDGFVTDDLSALWQHELDMKAFAEKCLKK